MVSITIDEITLNTVRAALLDRHNRLSLEVEYLAGQPESEDRDRAFVWCVAAQQQTAIALDLFSELRVSDYPSDMTVDQLTWTAA